MSRRKEEEGTPIEEGKLICATSSQALLKFLSLTEIPLTVGGVEDRFTEMEIRYPSYELDRDITYLEALGLVEVKEGPDKMIVEERTIEATALGKYFANLFTTPSEFQHPKSGEE